MSTSLVQSSAMNMADWEKQGHGPGRSTTNEATKQEDDEDDDDAASYSPAVYHQPSVGSDDFTSQQLYGYNDAPTMHHRRSESTERLMPYSMYETKQEEPDDDEDDRKMHPQQKQAMYAADDGDDHKPQTSIVSSPVQRGSGGDRRAEYRAAHGFQPSYDFEEAGPEQMMQPLPLHPNERTSWGPLEPQYEDPTYGGPVVYPPPPPQPTYPPPPQAHEYETQQPQYATNEYRTSSSVAARMHQPSMDHHRQQQQHHPRPYQPPAARVPEHHSHHHQGMHRIPSPPVYLPPSQQQQPPPQQLPVPVQRRTPRLASSQRAPSQDELAIASTPRAVQALQTWYVRFNELVDYCDEHGNCNVPQKFETNPQLGIWVNKQRMEKKFMDEGKRSSMTESKVRNLESIGFKWAKRKGQVSWNIKYAELQAFHAQQGHCDVPTKYKENQALGRWVSTQRSEYKKFHEGRSKHMTNERIHKLNLLQFKWEMLNGPPQPPRSASSDDDESDM